MEIEVGQLITKAKTKRCGDGEYPVLSMTMHDGLVFQNDRFKKQIASVDQSNYQVVSRHQLVESFPIDEGVLAVQELTDEGIVSPAYKIWDVDTEKVAPVYLEYALRSPRSIEYYKSKLRGTTARRRSITDTEFCAMKINCPSLDKQEEILDILQRTKQLINCRKNELEFLDELIKARFVELFGDPVLNEKGWKTCPFLDMGSCKNGMNFHYEDSGVVLNCLGVGDFKDYSVITNTELLPTVSLNEMPSEEYLLRDDDIVFVRSNGNKALVGRSVAVYPGNIPTTFSGFCIRYRKHDDGITIPYLLRVLKADSIRKKMTGRGANIQNLNQQILGTLIIPVPPLDLQKQFGDFVKQVDKSKVAVQKSLDETQKLFDSLMQEYFG
ncbi:type I restriction enzyme, S subunit [Pseudobutyrivibrio sp. JW11]|uniref:restriction endonuclease subunit S n=1 Tax=Pseudobutyrivibrio sp. JW11 TaxID=1855302 RepID=UPI0008F34C6F|nr:restriction endonuclease subunit S [Pseudobutyrivibrio sp. JW11]SFO64989.1 type I restriction enzyme, S subunit [Pseudobutyrivibrio sp. JW11]